MHSCSILTINGVTPYNYISFPTLTSALMDAWANTHVFMFMTLLQYYATFHQLQLNIEFDQCICDHDNKTHGCGLSTETILLIKCTMCYNCTKCIADRQPHNQHAPCSKCADWRWKYYRSEPQHNKRVSRRNPLSRPCLLCLLSDNKSLKNRYQCNDWQYHIVG